MQRRSTYGNMRLLEAGLIAFKPCGHWWVYPVRADPDELHTLAGFNLGVACSFCLTNGQAATRIHARGTTTRRN
jgi:hypothetical protein